MKPLNKILIAAGILISSVTTGFANQNPITPSPSTINSEVRYMEVNDNAIAYRIIGKGEPLLLMNRFRADMNHWDPVFVAELAAKHKVIMFDYPGIGLSGGAPANSIQQMSNSVIQFLNALNIKKTDALGWSLGTFVGMNAATNHAGRFDQLIIVGAPFVAGMQQAYATPDIEEFRTRASKPQPAIPDFLYLLFGDTRESRQLGKAALKRRSWWRTPAEGIPFITPTKWKQHAKAFFSYQKSPDTLDKINIVNQTLIVTGDRDHIAPPRIAAEWLQKIDGSQLYVVPSSGHNVHGQNPIRIAQKMLEFLDNDH